ncbi:MAG TPA: rhomboid family intramembrane serine protease [Chitinophagaceae bacterium]|nr:rhomboid family intramembrane serine protease [Chitinophagaceae bacterium]
MLSITIIIIVITCLVSIAGFSNGKIHDDLIFWPGAMARPNQYYRFFSYGFVHADYMHLIFNMLSLYFLGQRGVEPWFEAMFGTKGRILYIALYVLALVVSVLPDYFKHRGNYAYRALGASGAVCAVIFAAITLNPMSKYGLLFIPVRIPGWLFAILFLVLSTYLARRGRDNIGHSAHITGAVFGMVFTIIVSKVFADYDAVHEFIRQFRLF